MRTKTEAFLLNSTKLILKTILNKLHLNLSTGADTIQDNYRFPVDSEQTKNFGHVARCHGNHKAAS